MSRLSRQVLDAELSSRAGCVALRYNRQGMLVGIYRSDEAGLESDPELPWSVVCEAHGGIISTQSRRFAESAAASTDWCPTCQEESS